MDTFCPATMCPLIAPNGSPWTGEKNAPCPGHEPRQAGDDGCPWWGLCGDGCGAAAAAMEQVNEADAGFRVLQLGPVQKKRERAAPRAYDCPRAGDCQWQREAGDHLCPPRQALALGLDPRVTTF